jgi:hypothetical protein
MFVNLLSQIVRVRNDGIDAKVLQLLMLLPQSVQPHFDVWVLEFACHRTILSGLCWSECERPTNLSVVPVMGAHSDWGFIQLFNAASGRTSTLRVFVRGSDMWSEVECMRFGWDI